MMFGNTTLIGLLVSAFAVLVALICHEVAHGYVAYLLGDPTAKSEGRLTLNPLAHLDPLGTLLMLVAGFGWAKPVPVNPFYFRGTRTRGMMLVSVAGPATNLLIAFVATMGYVALASTGTADSLEWLELFLIYTIRLNIYLAVFNLIPIPPLDGSKILAGFLPKDKAYRYLTTLDRYGFAILMVLVLFDITDKILVPAAQVIINAYLTVAMLVF